MGDLQEPGGLSPLCKLNAGWKDAEANAALIVRAVNAHAGLVAALSDAITSSGFPISGPTDPRAAENGEPAWVCRAREQIALAST